MRDGYGREINYMRISITNQCNLRCRYCMPKANASFKQEFSMPQDVYVMSAEEILAAASASASLGIRHIKLTGGEPLLRSDCCYLVEGLKRIPEIESVTLTTNGVLLERNLDALAQAGIDSINISLDTLDRTLYEKLTGLDALEAVLNAFKRAVELSLPVKINAVSIDTGEKEAWLMVLELAKNFPVDVRFIELMPIGYGKNFPSIDHHRLFQEIKNRYPEMKPDTSRHGAGPAVYYHIPGFKGSIGRISAMHQSFCPDCNRIRLTADGFLKPCLCYGNSVNLREVFEQSKVSSQIQTGNANLTELLKERIRQAISEKPKAHCFEKPDEVTEQHSMAAIGG